MNNRLSNVPVPFVTLPLKQDICSLGNVLPLAMPWTCQCWGCCWTHPLDEFKHFHRGRFEYVAPVLVVHHSIYHWLKQVPQGDVMVVKFILLANYLPHKAKSTCVKKDIQAFNNQLPGLAPSCGRTEKPGAILREKCTPKLQKQHLSTFLSFLDFPLYLKVIRKHGFLSQVQQQCIPACMQLNY